VNLGNVPYGVGSTDAPARQARFFAETVGKQRLLQRFPSVRQKLIYRDLDRRDFAYEEPDGTRRAYLIFMHDGQGRWISGGQAYC
jgi:hypothetical protein